MNVKLWLHIPFQQNHKYILYCTVQTITRGELQQVRVIKDNTGNVAVNVQHLLKKGLNNQ